MKLALAALGTLLFAGTASAAPVFNAANGHYYEYVDGSFTFAQALTGAANRTTLPGFTSYLVTVTSNAERDFIADNVTSLNYWIAGSDAAVEGTWRWVAGPEAGQVFWQNGTTVTYSNWASGEPNNFENEDGLVGNFNGRGWNDASQTTFSTGYVVEYGANATAAVPEPASWALMIGGLGLVGAAARRRGARSLRTA